MKHPILTRLALGGWQLGLVIGAISLAVTMVVASPDTIKRSLAGSGAYAEASDVLTSTISQRVRSSSDSLVVSEESVRQAAQQTFTPQAIQATAERTVDDTYGWLRGSQPASSVRIGTGAYVDQFADKLAAIATPKTGAQGKPACTTAQLQALAAQAVAAGSLEALDAADLPCSPDQGVGQLVGGSVRDSSRDLANAEVTRALNSSALPLSQTDSGDSGQDIVLDPAADRMTPSAPTVYRTLVTLPWISFALAALSAVIVMLTMRGEATRAVKRLALHAVVAGVFGLIVAGLAHLILSYLTGSDGVIGRLAGDFGRVSSAFVYSLERSASYTLALIGTGYVTVGILALAGVSLYRRRSGNRSTPPSGQ